MMVADEPKGTLLGKSRGLIIDRAVPEAENQTRHYHIFPDGLGKITCCKNLALQRAYREKTVVRSLTVAHGYGFGWQGAELKQNERQQPDPPQPFPHAQFYEAAHECGKTGRVNIRTPAKRTYPNHSESTARVTVQYWSHGRVLEPARTILAGVGKTYIAQELGG